MILLLAFGPPIALILWRILDELMLRSWVRDQERQLGIRRR